MGERRNGPGGRDAAGLVGDAVMSAIDQLVERLRTAEPAEGPPERAVVAPRPGGGGARGDEGGWPAASVPAGVADLVGAIVAAIVPAVLSRIDPDDVLDRVDVQRFVDRVDLDEIVARIDLDALAGRLDVDALLARVDMAALVHRLDIAAITQEALEAVDIGDIVRESTASIGTDVVDDVRLQAIRADEILARWVDAVLRRRDPRDTALRARGAPR